MGIRAKTARLADRFPPLSPFGPFGHKNSSSETASSNSTYVANSGLANNPADEGLF
jgi:hypothetical protein